MEIVRTVVGAVVAVGVAGCVVVVSEETPATLSGDDTEEIPTTLSVYNPAEGAFIHRAGTNELRGQAFLRQRDGDVVTCASNEVWLIPVTTYASERIRNIYGTTSAPAVWINRGDDADPRYWQDQRDTLCDAQGNFAFESVADGDYFVVTSVDWEAATGPGGRLVQQGGAVMHPVSVRGGEVVRIIISP